MSRHVEDDYPYDLSNSFSSLEAARPASDVGTRRRSFQRSNSDPHKRSIALFECVLSFLLLISILCIYSFMYGTSRYRWGPSPHSAVRAGNRWEKSESHRRDFDDVPERRAAEIRDESEVDAETDEETSYEDQDYEDDSVKNSVFPQRLPPEAEFPPTLADYRRAQVLAGRQVLRSQDLERRAEDIGRPRLDEDDDDDNSGWTPQRLSKLRTLAKNALYSAVLRSAIPLERGSGGEPRYFLQAGDLPQMWLRDAAAGIHHHVVMNSFPRRRLPTSGSRTIGENSYVSDVVQGLTTVLAEYVLKDPSCQIWEPFTDHPGGECRNGPRYINDIRSEIDGIAYFLRLVRFQRRRLSSTSSAPGGSRLRTGRGATRRFSEEESKGALADEDQEGDLAVLGRLARGGPGGSKDHAEERAPSYVASSAKTWMAVGKAVAYLQRQQHPSGFLHTGSRPSDDLIPTGYFNIPVNLFVANELFHLADVYYFTNPGWAKTVRHTAKRVVQAVQSFGTVPVSQVVGLDDVLVAALTDDPDSLAAEELGEESGRISVAPPGARIFCFEANPDLPEPDVYDLEERKKADSPHGKRCALFDDANLPNLLGLPYMIDYVPPGEESKIVWEEEEGEQAASVGTSATKEGGPLGALGRGTGAAAERVLVSGEEPLHLSPNGTSVRDHGVAVPISGRGLENDSSLNPTDEVQQLLPLLHPVYCPVTYFLTRVFVLSPLNPFFFQSPAIDPSTDRSILEGLGSPHPTGGVSKGVWHLGLLAQALTSADPDEISHVLQMLVDSVDDDNPENLKSLHESVATDPRTSTRPWTRRWFDWPNAVFSELLFYMGLLEFGDDTKGVVDGGLSVVVDGGGGGSTGGGGGKTGEEAGGGGNGFLAARDLLPPQNPYTGWATCGHSGGYCRAAVFSTTKGNSEHLVGTKGFPPWEANGVLPRLRVEEDLATRSLVVDSQRQDSSWKDPSGSRGTTGVDVLSGQQHTVGRRTTIRQGRRGPNDHGIDGISKSEVCVRFGSNFSGWVYRKVRAVDLGGGWPCDAGGFEESMPIVATFEPYHCAVSADLSRCRAPSAGVW